MDGDSDKAVVGPNVAVGAAWKPRMEVELVLVDSNSSSAFLGSGSSSTVPQQEEGHWGRKGRPWRGGVQRQRQDQHHQRDGTVGRGETMG